MPRWSYLYRKRWRRYARTYAKKRFIRIWNANKYKTKQKLSYCQGMQISAGSRDVELQLNVYNLLTSMVGWDDFSKNYNGFRISFVKAEMHVSMVSTGINTQQEIHIAFYPGERDNVKTVGQIMSTNNRGYASYNGKRKTLLWRATRTRGGLDGYSQAMPVQAHDNIVGMFFCRNALPPYIVQTVQQHINIGTIIITFYIEFYDNIV